VLVTSFRRVQAVPLGFRADEIVTATVSLPSGRYGSTAQRTAFFDDVLRRLRERPNVADVAIANRVPFLTSASAGVVNTIQVVGDAAQVSRAPRAGVMTVSPGYFDLLRIRRVEGRLFSAQDKGGQPGVVIVDETVARALAPGGKVTGTRIQLGGATGADTATREIVGVVAAVRMGDVTRPAEPLLYLPYAQSPWPTMNVIARGGTNYGALGQSVRQTIASVDATRPVYNVRELRRGVDDAVASRRLETLLLSGFAVSASLLAFLGVYSVLSFSVKTREREFGIRLAVGADSRQVLREVVLESLKRVGAGVALGLPLIWVAGMLIRAALFDVSPWHLPAVVGAITALVLGALAASYLPARRAAITDPAVTLRVD
jgi:predicted permease